MNTQTQHNIQPIVAIASGLVIIGGGLNILAIETLGSFNAAAVILALLVGFWAFVLGNIGLILSSIWLFMGRKVMLSEPTSARPQAHEHELIALPALGRLRMCRG